MFVKHWMLSLLTVVVLSGCASLGLREPININVAGLDPLSSEGLEMRFAIKLRVQNPNDREIHYDGISVNLDIVDKFFGSGVSPIKGTLPRYGETVITVPVSVPFTAMVRQFWHAAQQAPGEKLSYRLRGHLGGGGFGVVHFDQRGELDLTPVSENP